MNPENNKFPRQVELFARKPDILQYEGQGPLVPIPVDAGVSGLSAILMDDEYYSFTIAHSTTEEGIHQANPEALICLKAKAFLDMKERKASGGKVDERNIRKHKLDVFRLSLLLTPDHTFSLPDSIRNDILEFIEEVKEDLPDKNIFKEMGAAGANAKDLLALIVNSFELS